MDFPAVSFCNLNALRDSQLTLGGSIGLQDIVNEMNEASTSQMSGEARRRKKKKKRSVEGERDESGEKVVDCEKEEVMEHRAARIKRTTSGLNFVFIIIMIKDLKLHLNNGCEGKINSLLFVCASSSNKQLPEITQN